MMEELKVGIVILNWNTYSETATCLDSLKRANYDNISVVVVDNGSNDDSPRRLSEEYTFCDFIFNQENIGFAGGCNIGIDHVLDNGVEYVLLLNNDIRVTEDFLEPLVDTAESHNRVAAVGGLVYDGDNKIWYNGRKINPYIADITEDTNAKIDNEFETEFVTLAYALLAREFIKENRLDENFFFGVEEIDLSWRANEQGWKLYVNPESNVYHYDAASTDHMFEGDDLFSSFQKYHNTWGRLYFSHKNLKLHQKLTYAILSLTLYPVYYFWIGLKYNRMDILYAHFLAIKDYVLKNKKKMPGYFSQ